ncbi:phosphoribosylformylglycinamidine synthase [Thermoactinomyces sp. DSM 45891]|uniref:phosphoribosylformylglycinamidine synthase subunit PurS n=1 Tax=Thermoactinomyces sp. DSM 45891 TaxID=1761907 RepID=UPI0009221D2D|nr:phosphoribosylformylglycinamidine synthase subunit PurS [Thermoactinomyces sp. DSM 45891]SFX67509.1 phosphoribosylformylglycinamidine synthase [Thermoactinomyces sp. DSM 45891]
MLKAVIFITLKESVLDPQGVAVKNSLHTMGYQTVADVRIGKRLEVVLDTMDRQKAEEEIRVMCERLLSNPVMENFTFEIEEVDESAICSSDLSRI